MRTGHLFGRIIQRWIGIYHLDLRRPKQNSPLPRIPDSGRLGPGTPAERQQPQISIFKQNQITDCKLTTNIPSLSSHSNKRYNTNIISIHQKNLLHHQTPHNHPAILCGDQKTAISPQSHSKTYLNTTFTYIHPNSEAKFCVRTHILFTFCYLCTMDFMVGK